MRVLLVDNFCSFTGNIYDALKRQRTTVTVVPPQKLDDESFDRIVIGPGPGEPRDVQVIKDQIPYLKTPLLGICLGHQLIAAAYGADIIRAKRPCHGKQSLISHRFSHFPSDLKVGRYHSLIVKASSLPSHLTPVAWAENEIMALKHNDLKQTGLQFHPDSFLTQKGDDFFKEFLEYGEIP